MAAAADKEACGEKMAAEKLTAMKSAAMERSKISCLRKTRTTIAQCSALVTLLIFCFFLLLVFAGDEEGQDK